MRLTRRDFLKTSAASAAGLLLPRQALWTPSYGQTELIHTIRRCGLTSGLKLCLDAGDANSYSSGQSWLDTSGNGYDFFRGTTSGAEASDPTFNGTAGRRSSGEYWSFDGGDYFTYDSANETWMQSLHKVGAKFTLLAWRYVVSGGGSDGTAGTSTAASYSDVGFNLTSDAGGTKLQLEIVNGGGTGRALGLIQSTNTFNASTWNFCAVSLDEAVGANGGIMFLNGTVTTFTSTYTSPSSGNATATFGLCQAGGGHNAAINNSRLGMFATWSGVALTQAQLYALYQATRGRFGV